MDKWEWWAGNNDEYYTVRGKSRDEVLEEAKNEWPGESIFIVEAVFMKVQVGIADEDFVDHWNEEDQRPPTERIVRHVLDAIIDSNDECWGEDGPDDKLNDEAVVKLKQALDSVPWPFSPEKMNSALEKWYSERDYEYFNVVMFGKTRNSEVVGPDVPET